MTAVNAKKEVVPRAVGCYTVGRKEEGFVHDYSGRCKESKRADFRPYPKDAASAGLYAGGMVGFQMGRVETVTPYSGEMINDNVTDDEGQTDGEQIDDEAGKEPIELFRPTNKAGTVWAIRGALVTGIEYSIMKGMILGFEVQPAAYNYTVLRIQPQGMASYNAAHHNIRVLACPSLKIGFRF